MKTIDSSLSPLKLIEHADPVVQAVMILLAIASIACWTIGLEKLFRFIAISRQMRAFEDVAARRSKGNASWLAARFESLANAEPRDTTGGPGEFQLHLEKSFTHEIGEQLRRLQSGLPVLATVGSTAPFVGLFGTVWGIMNSFTGIANAKDTSLAVVAPGIAEALLATGIGLAAAIPAVILYNLANVYLTNFSGRLASAADRYAKIYTDAIRRDEVSKASSARTV